MSLECTTEDCQNHTSTYLCKRCVEDLQAWIDKVPAMRAELFTTMAKLDAIAPRSSGGGGGKAEYPSPVNNGAMDLRHALLIWEGQDAKKLALDKFAGGFMPMLQDLIKKSERAIDLPMQKIVYGPCQAPTEFGECEQQLKAAPEAETITCRGCGTSHDVVDIIESRTKRTRGNPMSPTDAREYLYKKTKTFVTKKDIENWVMLGHLSYVLARVTTTAKPPRIYYPGDILSTHQRMKDRKRVA